MLKLVSFVVAVSFLFCGGAFAAPYVSGSLGMVMTNDSDVNDPFLAADGESASISYDTGFLGAIAVGNSFGGLRVEGEFAYRQGDIDQLTINDPNGVEAGDGIPASYKLDLADSDYNSMTLMANVYYDFLKDKVVSPFVGCGLGVNRVEATLEGTSEKDTVLAYSLAAGASVKVSEKVNLDLTYKYLSGPDLSLDGTDVELSSNNITAGVRVQF